MKLLLFILLVQGVFAWEMLAVKSVSNTGRTFVTQIGAKNGVQEGQKVMFSNSTTNFIAKAVVVTREFTVWTPENKVLRVPFEADDLVTFSRFSEVQKAYIPELSSDESIDEVENGHFIVTHKEEKIEKAQISTDFWNTQFSFGQGISETTSFSDDLASDTRTQMRITALYAKSLAYGVYLRAGIGGDRDIGDSETVSNTSTRTYFLVGLLSYWERFRSKTWVPYTELLIGYGTSSTETDTSTRSGNLTILPNVSLGMEKHLGGTRFLQMSAGLESILVKEEDESQQSYESQQINTYLAISLKFTL